MALAGQSRLELAWLSGTELHTGSVGPLAPVGNARYCMKPTDFGVRFGAPGLPLVPVAAETVKINLGIVGAAKASLRKVPEAVMVISKVLSKLPTGQVPIESMGGPLQIFDIAAQSAARGWEDFLTMMAVVSVNLALVNLLPIPILDGFNILLSLWEGVRRRPASLRARELTTYLGLVVLVSMMFRAFWNDIARLLFC
jgi:regulator of sigma E protease